MRKSTRAAAPIFVLTLYYIACFATVQLSLFWFPQIEIYLPFGGIDNLLERGVTSFDRMEILSSTIMSEPHITRLAIASVVATLLMIPLSWVYFITTPDRQVDRSFAQTMLILPIIVAETTGIQSGKGRPSFRTNSRILSRPPSRSMSSSGVGTSASTSRSKARSVERGLAWWISTAIRFFWPRVTAGRKKA